MLVSLLIIIFVCHVAGTTETQKTGNWICIDTIHEVNYQMILDGENWMTRFFLSVPLVFPKNKEVSKVGRIC